MIDIVDAMNLIEYGLEVSGYNVIPRLKSFLVKDLFEIFSEEFGLTYQYGEPRVSEKLHEIMIATEEVPRTHYIKDTNTYYMHYTDMAKDNDRVMRNEAELVSSKFGSDDSVLPKEELRQVLENYNYFKQ